MAIVSYSELESLNAEFLPRRIALSIINVSYVHNTYTTNEFPAQGGGHGSTVDACNVDDSPAGSGGLLGLFGNSQQDTMQCVPAATSGG
ncbi:MAG: hypothetical protein J2P25_25520 [Nocardiopsaceae bacterium]|nr:hypothetical protein [Nocardiopsaceae bacterium]